MANDQDTTGYGPGSVVHNAGVEEARERVKLNRELERDDAIDSGLAEAAVRAEVGDVDFEQGKRVLLRYLAGLPPEERERIENATARNGGQALHDPTTLRALAKRALGEMPRTREAAEAELAEGRKLMREDPKDWYSDDKRQLRFRILLRAMGNE